MKRLLIAMCFAAALAAAPQDSKTAAKKTKAAAEKPLTAIPASAVKIEPGAYRYTDANGKKWLLFETPFGIAKKEDTGEPLRKKMQEDHTWAGVKIAEDGDSLNFVREGPFGTYKWSKKKIDLTPEEKAAWQAQQDRDSGGAPKTAAAKQDK